MSEQAFDVIVVGSGAAGLTTALVTASAGLRTLVLESAWQFGGTTAVSGGRAWVPNNGFEANSGDTPKAAKTYLRSVYGDGREAFIDAYVDSAPRMQHFIAKHTLHRWAVCPNYPDYHLDREGAVTGGRCLDMEVLWTADLSPVSRNVREAPGYVPITHQEWEEWRYPRHYDTGLLMERYESGGRTGGQALAVALLGGALQLGVELRRSTTVSRVLQEHGSVVGVTAREESGMVDFRAKHVVIAAGGFDHDPDLWQENLPAGARTTAAATSNRGLGVHIAQQLGLPVNNMAEGWWMPMIQVPGEEMDSKPYPRGLVRERGVPRSIIVNKHGIRFMNEASPYNEFGHQMHVIDENGDAPNSLAYLVFDQGFRERYPLPGLQSKGKLASHIVQANNLSDLAVKLGIPSLELVNSVQRWNDMCVRGEDLDFARGSNYYDRYYGDPWHKSHPNLGPVDAPPYYAVQILSGLIGTKGGLITRPDGEVVDKSGATVPGLYAAGNSASHWTGSAYPGPGSTLGLGMTFGMLAAERIISLSQ